MMSRDENELNSEMKILRETHGVTQTVLQQGQVVMYRGHLPIGFYVVTKGAFDQDSDRSAHEQDAGRIFDARRGPFVFPPPVSLNQPMPMTTTVKRKAEVFFIPRSLFLRDLDLRRFLETL